MKRAHPVTVCSAVLLDLALFFWGFSHRTHIAYTSTGEVWNVRMYDGVIQVVKSEAWGKSSYVHHSGFPWDWGFGFSSGHPGGNWSYKHVTVVRLPLWFIAAVFGAAPAVHILRTRADQLRRLKARFFPPVQPRGFAPLFPEKAESSDPVTPPPPAARTGGSASSAPPG